MCGRARLSSDVSKIKLVFGIPPERQIPGREKRAFFARLIWSD